MHAAFGVVHGVGIGYAEVRVIVCGLDPGRHGRVVVHHEGQKRSVGVLQVESRRVKNWDPANTCAKRR
jgi:hypothetical protein